MVGGALVAEGTRHGRVDAEGSVGKGELELAQRFRPFVAAVRHRLEIGDGQVAAAVRRVGRGRDGGGVGGPHRRGGQRLRLEVGGSLRIGRRQCVEPAMVGAGVGRQDALREPEREIGAHLRQALERRLARAGDLAGVARGGEIAGRETGIIVAGPDDAVEVDLDQSG